MSRAHNNVHGDNAMMCKPTMSFCDFSAVWRSLYLCVLLSFASFSVAVFSIAFCSVCYGPESNK